MKKTLCCLSLLPCLYLLKAGWPVSSPTAYLNTTTVSAKNQMQQQSAGKAAYQAAPCVFTNLYVDSSRRTSGSGSSWPTAYKQLSEAFDAAAQCPDITTIYVARGTYKPTNNQ